MGGEDVNPFDEASPVAQRACDRVRGCPHVNADAKRKVVLGLENASGNHLCPIEVTLDKKVGALKCLISQKTGMRRECLVLASAQKQLDRDLPLRNFGIKDNDVITVSFRAPAKPKSKRK